MSDIGSDNGWLEAAIAWEVCASLHRQYCKGKDALFTTRQSDFVKHAEDARARASHGQASSQPECLTCNDHGAVGNILTAEPCPDCTRKAAPAAVTGSSEAVAYLDIGTGGYLDLGTDLADEAVSRLPKGRHALVIAGTYGIDGYTAALTTQPAPQQGAADGFFLLLPQRPKPEAPAGTAGLDWDAYSGAQMLAFGRDCSDAAIAALRAQQPAPATQQAGGRVYAFRRKGLADFCTCDEARYEELSNKPHLFETRVFYTAPQPAQAAHAAESVPAEEREKERIAFKDAHRHLELDEVPDAWGRPMFKHSHVETSWLGWIARAARAPAESVPTAQFDDPKVQVVYAILCDDADTPKGEHWEGFAARRIVDALSADSVQEDAAQRKSHAD